jgi:membrane AbrB-like protein
MSLDDLAVLALMLASAGSGAMVARWCRVPMWPLTGAIAGTAAVHLSLGLSVDMPRALTIAAQILVGTAVGSRVDLRQFAGVRRLAGPAALTVVGVVGTGVALGLGLGATGLVDHVTGALGTIPGGGGEMVAAAEALQADGSVVAAMHVVRVFLVVTLLSWMLEWAHRRYGGAPDEAET